MGEAKATGPSRLQLSALQNQIAASVRRIKVTHIINSYNEGPEVRRTIESFARSAGNAELSWVVVADGTTDGSCDDLPENVLVLKTEKQLGCGQSKFVAVKHAIETFNPDVILHSDGHNRIINGTVEQIAHVAMANEPCIVTPAVGPLRCANKDTCKQHATKACTVECERIVDNDEIPNNCYNGGTIQVNKETGWLRVNNVIADLPERITRTDAVNPSCFAYTPQSLARLGGWNRYPGIWGAQELGVSLRAWFTATPILALRSDLVCTTHRYRSWNHPEGKALAPYSIPNDDADANLYYAHRLVFDDETFQELFTNRNANVPKPIIGSFLDEQKAEFRSKKVRTDDELIRIVYGKPIEDLRVKPDADRILYCLGAGLGNVLICIPAIKMLHQVTGLKVDVYGTKFNRGQTDGTVELLKMQPWVNKVMTEVPDDLTYYKAIVASWFGAMPPIVPAGCLCASARQAGWRTRHEVELNLDAAVSVLTQLGYKQTGPIPSARLTTWKSYPIESSEFITIGVGCNGLGKKRYPHWETACRLLAEYGAKLVFLGSDEEDQPWMDKYGINLCGKTSIAEAAGAIWSSVLYIGIDNGLSHLAASVGTPGIVVYGYTQERKNAPWGSPYRLLRANVCKYEPCFDRNTGKCPDGENLCMSMLRPEWIVNNAINALERPAWYWGSGIPLYYSSKQWLENCGLKSMQCHEEFAALIDMMKSEQVVNVLEIGSNVGGWLAVMAKSLGRGMRMCAVDTAPVNPELVESCGGELLSIEGNSHSKETQTRVAEWVNKVGTVDLLHIDACHEFDDVVDDFRMYEHFVRPGGFVVLHDVAATTENGPRFLWGALCETSNWELATSFIRFGGNRPGTTTGIGVLKKALVQ